jgi:malonyl-CoA O-methyltransferase
MNQLTNEWEIEKGKIKKIFNQVAPYYQQYAELMQVVGEDMLTNLSLLTIKPQAIVDLGSGAGFFITKLQALYPTAKMIAVDNAEEMLKHIVGTESIIHSDAENIALPNQSVDVIFANLLLPWSMNPVGVIQECYRILKSGGVFFFSSFGPDTFKELTEHQIFPEMH